MNSQKLTDLLESVRTYHSLAVNRAESKYTNLTKLYSDSLVKASKELIHLGDSGVWGAANWVQEYHFEVIDEILLNDCEYQWYYQQLFEKAMVELERAVNNFKKESAECSYGQPICTDCSTDIENCSCQEEVAMSIDGKVKITNEELDMRTPTMLWLDITNAAHKQAVGKDGKMGTIDGGLDTRTPNTSMGMDGVADISKVDVVNNPNHYQLFPGTEAIEVIAKSLTPEGFKGYCLGNALKYRLRAGKKGDAEQDLAKADKYVELYNKYK